MTPANFLPGIKNIPNPGGSGILRRVSVPLAAILGAAGANPGAIAAGAFGFKAVETNGLALAWNGEDVTEVLVETVVPVDYDAESDELKLRLLVQMGGATDTPALTADVFRKRAGAALSADLAVANTEDASATASWLVLDISGKGLQAGDVVQVFVTPEDAHDTDALHLYGVEWEYRGVIVNYDADNR